MVNNDDLVFKSDNESVATVNENGDVIPVYNGQCNIICYLKSNDKVYATCNVSVSGIDFKRGDANKDGAVNSVDAAFVIDIYKNNVELTQDEFNFLDINKDGAINSVDSASIIDMYKNNI